MRYLVDIDNTICFTEAGDYENAQPNFARIKKLNRIYDKGNIIIYWTARGDLTGKNYDPLTRNQLKSWGVKYHKLIRKPFANCYIDDLAINANDFFK